MMLRGEGDSAAHDARVMGRPGDADHTKTRSEPSDLLVSVQIIVLMINRVDIFGHGMRHELQNQLPQFAMQWNIA